ncbi:MAG: adenylate/guanylate cyclase domain-containing protein [Actinobacteria bacterium]|nr:adenylate/guanylate cyclase domain-containing protein [Actinomycetota bacterium]
MCSDPHVRPPRTRYVRSGDQYIAYQVVGEGPDLLNVPPIYYANLDYVWTHPVQARALERLAQFARLILVDRRGSGLSDPVCGESTVDDHMDDFRAVLDAVGSERATVLGVNEGAIVSSLLAASFPDRFASLVLFSSFVTRGADPERGQRRYEAMLSGWGTAPALDVMVPTLADDGEFRDWWARWERMSASPTTIRRLLRSTWQLDLRPVLEAIRVPALVLHRTRDRSSHIRNGRAVAEAIPGARFVELDGEDAYPWAGDADSVIDEIEEFVVGERRQAPASRALATVLFTDIVRSTERAAELGDQRWRAILEDHDRASRSVVEDYGGRVVKSLGDGLLALFDTPTRAVRAACDLRAPLRAIDIDLRAGLHTGECEVLPNDDVAGIAVHIGARIAALAAPGEVLVSSTVKDLVVGSGIGFEDRGLQGLKGVPEPWRVLAVVDPN